MGLVGPARAQVAYVADLGPMPLDAATAGTLLGRGSVTATVVDSRLVLQGNFEGLTSPATQAELWLGPAIGVPGEQRRAELSLADATAGALSGSAPLDANETAALREGRLYVTLASRAAPTGALWGWLLPAHADPAAGKPSRGDWFLPHVGAPSRWRSSDPMAQR